MNVTSEGRVGLVACTHSTLDEPAPGERVDAGCTCPIPYAPGDVPAPIEAFAEGRF